MNSAPSSIGCPDSGRILVQTRPPSRERASSSRTLRPVIARRLAAARPATPPPTTITSQRIRFRFFGAGLLVPQGDDGVQLRSSACRPDSEEETHGRAESEGDTHGHWRNEGVPLHHLRQQDCGSYPEQNTDHPA